jgi:hypothetical protein
MKPPVRKSRRYLRKSDVRVRYGWKSNLSVDRAWMKYHTIPEPTIYQSRAPLWAEEVLDKFDDARRHEASV